MTPKQKKLRNQADKLFQLKYTKGNCISCCVKPADCVHHYIPKSQSNYLRFDACNAIPICRGCHTKHHLSGDPNIINEINKRLGQGKIRYLQENRYMICKFTTDYLQSMIEELSNQR